MRKFKFMPKLAAGMLAVAMTFGSLSGLAANSPVVAYAADESKIDSVSIVGPDAVNNAVGDNKFSARVESELAEGKTLTYAWSIVESGTKSNTKFTTANAADGVLTVDGEETLKEFTVKLTVSVDTVTKTAEKKVVVADAALLIIDYGQEMPFQLSTNSTDTFVFLDVMSKDGKKVSATYCYELPQDATTKKSLPLYVDPSAFKLTKGGTVRVRGNVNTTSVKDYTLTAQIAKPALKYQAGADIYSSFLYGKGKSALTKADAKTLQWKLATDSAWKPFVSVGSSKGLESYLDSLTIAGSTILVRSIDNTDVTKMPSPEIKVKISAAGKAPKVTQDYAKNTIKFAKNMELRVPGWDIPAVVGDKSGGSGKEVKSWKPFYYDVPDNMAKTGASPAALLKELVEAYAEALEDFDEVATDITAKQTALTADYDAEKEKEDKANGKTEEVAVSASTPTFAEKLLYVKQRTGYNFLARTKKTDKKAASQPTFINVEDMPKLEVKQVEETVDGKKVMVATNAIAVTTIEEVEEGGKTTYKKKYDNTMEFEWTAADPDDKKSKDTLTLKKGTGTATFSYSLDDGNKWTEIKKDTVIDVSKIDKSKGVLVRLNGIKTKDGKGDAWGSGQIQIPVGVKSIELKSGKTEITAAGTETYTVEVKDFFGNTVKTDEDPYKVTWNAVSGTAAGKIVFTTTDGAKLEVKTEGMPAAGGTDTKVVLKATCNGVEATFEVTIKAPAASNPS